MHFVIYCLDKADHAHVRAENRPAHVEFLKAHADKIVAAGPLLSDPYAKAGLFQSVDIRPWKKVFPAD